MTNGDPEDADRLGLDLTAAADGGLEGSPVRELRAVYDSEAPEPFDEFMSATEQASGVKRLGFGIRRESLKEWGEWRSLAEETVKRISEWAVLDWAEYEVWFQRKI